MNILHVIHSLDPRSGGPSSSVRQLARYQLERGHAVSILTTDAQSAEPWAPDSEYRRQLAGDPLLKGIRVLVAKGYGRWKPLARLRYSPRALQILDRLLDGTANRAPVDFVHVHGLFSHLTMEAPRLCRYWNVRYAVRPAGGLNPYCLKQGNQIGKRLLFAWRERRNMERAAFIHATSEREADELRELFPRQRIQVIPHGTDLPATEDARYARQVFFRKFPTLEGRRIVLYLSRIAPKKRLDLLIEAVRRALPKHPNLLLAVAGADAGFQARAEAMVREHQLQKNVVFLGFLAGMLKEGAFGAADLLALPSEDENFGLVIAEAMAHGLPVLVSEGVDSHTFVKDARAGVVVKSTAQSVHRGLELLLAADLKTLGANGRRYAQERLSWREIVLRLDALYGKQDR